ncbi:YdeI/OmpD-associated family protein [Flavobacterium sp. RHBU_24]|uniref:YdeI/OmpD-associated family protein n=1 Tax=Flavobacterium sp. RHBU_24 TaxID=3391185 RepID=UPI00398549AA
MEPTFFKTQNDFRLWLEDNYKSETELLVGFYKVGSGKESMTWPESVDQAVCYGWIDGVRRTVDGEAYSIRFTPRRAGSIWSAVNIAKVEKLTKVGLMKDAGLAAFGKRTEAKSRIYAFEQEKTAELPEGLLSIFKADKPAWTFFEAQPPGYKKQILHRIVTAKQEKTKLQRLEKLIEASAQNKRLT